MIGTIIITFVITALSMTLLYMTDTCRKAEREHVKLRRTNEDLREKVTSFCVAEQDTRENNAYNRGLHDGRETDALYRGILAKHSRGEQATVLMYGEQTERLGAWRQ